MKKKYITSLRDAKKHMAQLHKPIAMIKVEQKLLSLQNEHKQLIKDFSYVQCAYEKLLKALHKLI